MLNSQKQERYSLKDIFIGRRLHFFSVVLLGSTPPPSCLQMQALTAAEKKDLEKGKGGAVMAEVGRERFKANKDDKNMGLIQFTSSPGRTARL